MQHSAGVVVSQTFAKIICQPSVKPLFVYFALKNVDVVHELACRVVARHVCVARRKVSAFAKATARQSSLSPTEAREDWRQGDYAPASASDSVPGLLDFASTPCGLWRQGDSNPCLPACKAGALPTEL